MVDFRTSGTSGADFGHIEREKYLGPQRYMGFKDKIIFFWNYDFILTLKIYRFAYNSEINNLSNGGF